MTRADASSPRAIVSSSWAAGSAVSRRCKSSVELRSPITLVERRNCQLFQPLSYQVATGALSPSDVAYPLRSRFKGAANVEVCLAEVVGFDLEKRAVLLDGSQEGSAVQSLPYDTLIVAGGSDYSYFGHDEFAQYAAEVKTVESAVTVSSRILRAFARAEAARIAGPLNPDITFVVVGATNGRRDGRADRRTRAQYPAPRVSYIDPRAARVLLVEVGDRVLAAFPSSLSTRAARPLERLGVTVLLGQNVVDVDTSSVTVAAADGASATIEASTVIWDAGVTASGLARQLGEQSGADIGRGGHVVVEPDLTLASHPEVIALGDMVHVPDADCGVQSLPGAAPIAIQQGRYAARLVRNRLRGRQTPPFRYWDKGSVATIGRGRAVVDLHVLRLSGFVAWLVWLVVHVWYLNGFRNRVLVMVQWALGFITSGRGSRLIVEQPAATVPAEPDM